MNPFYATFRKISLALFAIAFLFSANQANANCDFHAGFTATASNTNCKQINFTNTSFVTNSNDSGVSYLWQYGSSIFASTKNASYTFSANGTYTVCLIMFKQVAGSFCADTSCQTITVNCSTGSGCSWGTIGWEWTRSCSSKNIYFHAINSDSTGTYKYTWGFGDASYDTLNHAVTYHNYATAGQFSACLNIKKYVNGSVCKDTTICKTIYVLNPVKAVDFSYTPSSSNCKDIVFTVIDSNNMSNTACAYYRYTWGDGTTTVQTSKTSPTTHSYASNGSYTVCIKAMACSDTTCYTSTCKTISVNCNTSSGCNIGYVTWGSSYNCSTRTVSFSGYVTDTTGNIKYLWAFGDGSYDSTNHKSTTHVYPNNGTYTVCFSVRKYLNGNICKDTTVCKTVTVTSCSSSCALYGTWTYNVSCPTRTVSFNSYVADSGGIYSYLWSFGDNSNGSTAKNITHTYSSNGTYNVCLTIKRYSSTNTTTPCHDTTICKQISVNCSSNTSCSLYSNWTYSLACPSKTVAFTSYVGDTTGTYSYEWIFGDSSSGVATKNATHTYANNGSYTVCLKVKRFVPGTTTVCKDTTICKTVSVNCNATCSLYGGYSYSVTCPSRAVHFGAYVADTTGTYGYLWNFGDSSSTSSATTKDPIHTYSHNGTFTVCLTIKRFTPNSNTVCRDTVICKAITINCTSCALTAGWSYNVTCPTRIVHFGASVADTTGYYAYLWNFGDNTTGTTKDPAHTYNSNGTYNVCLTVKRYSTNAGTTTICHDTTICKTVVVNCSSGCNFGSQNPYFSVWDSCNQRKLYGYIAFNSSHALCFKYTWKVNNVVITHDRYLKDSIFANGTYNVCCTVVDTCNNCDTSFCGTRTITCIGNNSSCNFGIKNPYFVLGDSCNWVSGYIGPFQGCYKYTWKVNNTVVSHDRFFTRYAINANGTYNICVTVVDTCANCDTTFCGTRTITCYHACNSHASFGSSLNCATKKLEVINYSYGDSCMNYTWFWGDGSTSTAKNPGYHIYSSTGTYTVCLKVVKCSDSTCFNYYCKTVVIPTVCCPTPSFYSYNFCNAYHFINTTQGGTSFWWSFGDSSFSSQKSPYHSFFSKRAFQVCLTVFDSVKHCSTTVCKTVNVNCGWFGGGNHFEVPISDGNIGNAEKSVQENNDLTPSSGLQMNTKAGITAYPNPTNSILNIILPATNATVKITDITGAVLMQFENVSSFYHVDVSKLASGVYFVNVINESGTQSVRFMKN